VGTLIYTQDIEVWMLQCQPKNAYWQSGANSGFILSLRCVGLFCHSAFVLSLRCAARRASGRKEVSAFTRTHRYGFAYARLHGGLTSGRAYGARSMGRLEMRARANAIPHVYQNALHVVGQLQFHMFMKCVASGTADSSLRSE